MLFRYAKKIWLLNPGCETLSDFNLSLSSLWADPWAGPWVSGLHGPACIWAQAGPDHHAQTRGHPGGPEEADEGIEKKSGLGTNKKILFKASFAVQRGTDIDLPLNCVFVVPLSQQQKRKLRLYISNTFNPARPDADDSDGSIASWELRVEGKLLDDVSLFYS